MDSKHFCEDDSHKKSHATDSKHSEVTNVSHSKSDVKEVSHGGHYPSGNIIHDRPHGSDISYGRPYESDSSYGGQHGSDSAYGRTYGVNNYGRPFDPNRKVLTPQQVLELHGTIEVECIGDSDEENEDAEDKKVSK